VTDEEIASQTLEGFLQSDEWAWREEAVLVALNLAHAPLWDFWNIWQMLRCLRAARSTWMKRKPVGMTIQEGKMDIPLRDILTTVHRVDG